MAPESFFSEIARQAEQVVMLFVVVCLAAVGMATLDKTIQGGLSYFIGSVCVGLALGFIAIAFALHPGWVLVFGVVGMATAPATIAKIRKKSFDEVIDRIRGRTPPGGGEGGS